MKFALTAKQIEACELLGDDATHTMLYGGSRSGKTFVLLRAMMMRAMNKTSRHVCLRYRFNHIKGSIIYDTLPKMVKACFPGVWETSHLDKSDWFLRLSNGSEIWFGGLDDKERTEKILGMEYSTIFFNECSQISWQARNIAITRLAQRSGMLLRAYYDANPPSEAHWTYRLFITKRDPETRTGVKDPNNYASLTMNPADNAANLPASYIKELESLPERMRRRFLLGLFSATGENALWSYELLDKCRVLEGSLPDMAKVVISVDPSGCAGEEDSRSDEVGIVVVGLGTDGKAYLLEDLSGKFGPAEWGRQVVAAYDRYDADVVVAEVNYGGAMVAEIIRGARAPGDLKIPFREVHASKAKHIRAEPISALYEQGKVIHGGYFEKLEDQLLGFSTAGYTGDRSPDRADALIWAINELFPTLTRRDLTNVVMPPRANLDHAFLKARRG